SCSTVRQFPWSEPTGGLPTLPIPARDRGLVRSRLAQEPPATPDRTMARDLLLYPAGKGTARGPVAGCARAEYSCLGSLTYRRGSPFHLGPRDDAAPRRSGGPREVRDEEEFAVRLLAAESGRCVRGPRREREGGLRPDGRHRSRER